jgi:hypothetical protein
VGEHGDVPLLDPLGVGDPDDRGGRAGRRTEGDDVVVATVRRGPRPGGAPVVVLLAIALVALVWWPRADGSPPRTPPTEGPSPTVPSPGVPSPTVPSRTVASPTVPDEAPLDPAGAELPAAARGRVVWRHAGAVSVVDLGPGGRAVTVSVDDPPTRSAEGELAVAVTDGRTVVLGAGGPIVLDSDLRPVGPDLPRPASRLVADVDPGRLWLVSRPSASPSSEDRAVARRVDLVDGRVTAAATLVPGSRVVGATSGGLVVEEDGGTVLLTITDTGEAVRRWSSDGYPIATGADHVALVECDPGFRCLLAVRTTDGAAVRTLPFGAPGAVHVLDAVVAPDGGTLAVLVDDPATTVDGTEVVTVELEPGGAVRRVVVLPGDEPAATLGWTPDGRVLLWGRAAGGGSWIGAHDRVTGVTGARWSPVPGGRLVGVLAIDRPDVPGAATAHGRR